MTGGLIAIKINNMLQNDNVLYKNGKLLPITKSQVNRILKDKYGKPIKVRKVFYLNETAKKKRLEFCQKIVQMGIEGKNILFTDETRMDTAQNTKGESTWDFVIVSNFKFLSKTLSFLSIILIFIEINPSGISLVILL